jgi:ABC-type uncharacterized transport system permease subunit
MHPELLWWSAGFYALSIVLAVPSVVRARPLLGRAALAVLAVAFALNGASLIRDALYLHRLPLTGIETALSFLAFSITAAFFATYRRYRTSWVAILVLPFVFILALASAALSSMPLSDSAALRGRWLVIHSSSMLVGYAALFLTFVAAVMYLMQSGELKSKRPKALYYYLPSLETCNRLYDRSLVFGLVCLTAGLLTGFLWANRAWSGPWEWDPKILASLLTWIIYLILLSTRLRASWRGRWSAYGAIFGFAAVMVTFLGITFMSVQHGYFPTISRLH